MNSICIATKLHLDTTMHYKYKCKESLSSYGVLIVHAVPQKKPTEIVGEKLTTPAKYIRAEHD